MVQILKIHVNSITADEIFIGEEGFGHTKLSHKSLLFETLDTFTV